ncbi:MAG TPA: DNA polymerase I, partial [bacterium]|nr:DNA polymerase I [bacterium]
MRTVFLIDANNIIYRSFFAIRGFTTSTGQPTNAIFGFVSTILKILKDYKPEYLAVAFDTPAPTFRHRLLEQYKITRKPMPEELSAQMPVMKEILKAFGITMVEKESFEADDLLACLALKFSGAGHRVIIVSGDKDILQLLSEKINVLNPASWELMDVEHFMEKYSFHPRNIVDYLALCGDASDCVPGVPGIGEKTASDLIKEFGTIENLYENVESVQGKRKQLLIDGKENVFLSKRLVQLSCDTGLEMNIEDIKRKSVDAEKIRQIFQSLEFRKFEPQLEEIFGLNVNSSIPQDAFAIGDRIFNFNEILANPFQFAAELTDEHLVKLGTNIKEKIKLLMSKNFHLSPPYFDFHIASFILGKSLSGTDIFQIYNAYLELFKQHQMDFLIHSIEMPLIEVLAFMEMNGVLVDTEYLDVLKKEYESEMAALQEKIYHIAGEVFNINSPSQVATILFDKLGLPPKRKTKTGYSTDTTVLEQLRSRHKIVELILQYRELSKLCSTYIDGFIPFINSADSRIHPEYHQTVASSGRLVCHNPNLQSIPVKTEKGGKIRKIFIAPENATLYSFDYSQIELRILAHFSKDKNLIEAFQNNRDIHIETAKQLFPLQQDCLFGTDEIEKYRRIAKTINFGIIYGMNEYGLAQRLACPVEEARVFIDCYFARFPLVKAYIQKAVEDAEKKGYASTLSGRRRYLPEIHSQNRNQKEFAKRVAVNMPIQGTAAELIKLAMIKIHDLIKKEKMKSKMILQVHDELVFEIS